MAHSTVPNAGQQYASAKKRGVNGQRLKDLKAAAMRRQTTPSPLNEAPEVINRRIEIKNREHQLSSRW